MHPAPGRCPTCAQPLETRELACPTCATTVRGRWAPDPFRRLTREQVTFLRLFVTSRGNLSDVERALGVSYPTVRAKLDDLIAALDEPSPTPPAPVTDHPDRQSLLAAVARGELDIDTALARLRRPPTEEPSR
ncbi:MAG: DUF2089 domain-containing protein [Chloroflexi bacterium]|nr:DUF2089 domain-containing protein [Chloroflexota bacterium]